MANSEIKLGVNIDHVATIRQARGTSYPDPVEVALLVEAAGADAITLHLREDRRHIQDEDVHRLKQRMQTRMNLEMAVTEEMVGIAEGVRPEDCCLVPEKREELTTEGGLDVVAHLAQIKEACERLSAVGTRVSLFIDADREQIDAAREAGAPVIELHTGHYADAKGDDRDRIFEQIKEAAAYAHGLGIQVNAGHGLTLENTPPIAGLPQIVELNIGHAIVADAITVGIDQAVKAFIEVMHAARVS